MSSYFKSFSLTIPEDICRFVVVGVVASLLATAVIYSRRERVTDEITAESTKQTFQQPKDRHQAEGWFIPAPKSADVFEQKSG